MDFPQEFLELSHETQQQLLGLVDDYFDEFPIDYFSKDSQGSASTTLESDQAENDSLETAVGPLDNLEEPVRHDTAMPTPVSGLSGDSNAGEDTAASSEDKPEELVRHDSGIPTPVSSEHEVAGPETEENSNSLFDGESGDDDSLFGDGDADKDTGSSSANKPEEPDCAPSPTSIQSGSDDEDDLEAALLREFEEAGIDTDSSNPSGEGDAGEDTGAPYQDKSAEPSQLDSAVPSPTPSDKNSEDDDIDSLFDDSSENTSSDPLALPAICGYRPTSPASPSRQPQSREESFGPSSRPLALLPQRPQPAVEQPNSEDPAVRFPGLALPRRKPAAPSVTPSTATPSAQPDANPTASTVASGTAPPSTQPDANPAPPVDAQSRKRTRDDDPLEIDDSSPEPEAKRARKEKEKSCKCKGCKNNRKCKRAGPGPCSKEELDARNGAARIQFGKASRKYQWMNSNPTQERYGQLPPSQTKEAKARREAVQQLANSIAIAETELPFDPAVMASDLGNPMLWSADGTFLPLSEDVMDTDIPVNSNDTTVDLRGEPSVSALQVSPPVSLFADRSNRGAQVTSSSTIVDLTEESSSTDGTPRSASLSTESSSSGISATSSRTTIDLTGESAPAHETSSPASLTPAQSNSGALATSSRTTIDLTREPEAASTAATSPMQREKEGLPRRKQTGQSVSNPGPNRPAATNGGPSVHDVLIRQQTEAMKEHTAAFTAEHRRFQWS
ncbi:hypothetical protein HII31_04253 [Pseudocercospora fuligena]|uniref:Uncharacterized protein n=1 Tax=Pseudocercospora fuligena TaxID=685502 RepID=A0A8H6RNM5_9PEZI|nr:hypothetical protein HII31_04253 [Pseudocercospora fuligena]